MRESLDFGGVAIVRVGNLSEVHAKDLDTTDLLIVRDQALDCGYVQPPRVEWFMDVAHTTLTEQFTGNHRRKLKRSYEQLEDLGITLKVVSEVTPEEFAHFLTIYREVIGSKEHPRLRLSEESFLTLRNEAPLLGVFAYRDSVCIGGTLVRDYGEYYALSYSAYPQFSRKELEVGLGVLLFDAIYQRSATEKRPRVSYGRDTNVYGFHLSMGLLEYKLSIGCTPSACTLEGIAIQTLFILRAPTQPVVALYAQSAGNGLELRVASGVSPEALHQQFSHGEEAVEVRELNAVIQEHRAYVSQHVAS